MKNSLDSKLYILSISKFFKDLGTGILAFIIPLYIVTANSSISTGIPEIVKAGIITTFYGIFNSLSQPLLGKLSDKLDRRKPFIIGGIIGFTLASLFFPFISNFETMVILRSIQGITVGMAVPAIVSMVTYFSTDNTRGRAIGIYTSIRGFGYGSGAILGGGLVSHYGFTLAFYFCTFLGLLSFLLILFFVDETHNESDAHLILEKSNITDHSSQIKILSIAIFIMMVGIMIIFAFLPAYETKLHTSEFSLSIAVSAYIFSRIILQTPIGILSDKYGRKKFILFGLLINIPIVLGLAHMQTIQQLIFLRAIQGISMAAVETPIMALAVDLVDKNSVSSNVSYLTSAQAAGTAFGPFIGGILGGYLSFETPFYLCAFMIVISTLIIAYKVKEPKKNQTISNY